VLARQRAGGRVVDDRLDLHWRRPELGQQPVDAQRERAEAEDLDRCDDVGQQVAVDVQRCREVQERRVAAHDLAAARFLQARHVLEVEDRDRAERLADRRAAGEVAADDLPGLAQKVADRVERLRLSSEEALDVGRADGNADLRLRVRRAAQHDRRRQRAEHRERPSCVLHRSPASVGRHPQGERTRVARTDGKKFCAISIDVPGELVNITHA
jgi:hypothetical protein